MLKKMLLLFLVFCCFTVPAFAENAKIDGGLTEVDAHKIWPQKANWVGQKAVFFMPKIISKVSFLFVYNDPAKPIWGSDQRVLTRQIANKNFVIKGLYRLTEKEETKYYWYLVSDELGGRAVWVRDYDYKSLADMPFSLPEEIEMDAKVKENLQALKGNSVWYNYNSSVLGDEVEHLEALTLADIVSEGPFSDNYAIIFKREDGTSIAWKSGVSTNPPVYNHQDLSNVLKESFYFKSPYDTYPKWKQHDWTMIKNREVSKGWTKDKVIMSWGKPNQISKPDSYEQWRYDDKNHENVIFFFNQDILVKILVSKQKKAAEGTSINNNDKHKQQADKKKTNYNDEFKDYEEVVIVQK